jgi:hypothetical protein
MVLRYSEQTCEEIFSSKEFLNCFERNYTNKNKEQLISFLNNIDTNKKYYKMGIHKNKRFKRVENTDTTNIKTINSLLNKLTTENYKNIIQDILKLVQSHILTYIIENIIQKSLLHHIYIELYVELLNTINEKHDINFLLNKILNKIYANLINEKNDSETYKNLIKKNNNLDTISGLSILITHLEKKNNIQNNSKKIINDLLEKVDYNDLDNLFKIVLCIFNIIKINTSLKSEYSDKLDLIKSNKINSKIKFKIMDIQDI